MAFDLGGYPFFFVDPSLEGQLFSPQENQGDGSLAAWKNYGGDKTWPSPQGWDTDDQWHGPPDPVLDTGRYRVSAMACTPQAASIEMESPPDPRTGIQIRRKVTLLQGGGRAVLHLSFCNISDRPRRWSIWDVAQLRAEKALPGGGLAPETRCAVTAPLNPASRFPQGFWVMFGAADNPQWKVDRGQGLIVADYAWEIGKIGSDACAPGGERGWIAFSNTAAGYAFCEQFPIFPGQEYPDNGSTVECWTVGKGRVANLDYEHSGIFLMETEVLSPLYTFQPGETHAFQIEWGVCRSQGRILDVQPAGAAWRRLSASSTRRGVRLQGGFGVFDVGTLRLAWLDASGRPLADKRLASVHPAAMLDLDQVFMPPARAACAVLDVLAQADGRARRLGECALPAQ